VLGRHGGDDSFDIPRIQKAVIEAAKNKSKIWFLFLNTREFSGATGLPNLRFLPATADPILKRRFFNTCDGMLHGRMRGETFGLSCLEFAMLGKPVLTYAGSPEKAHLEILGDTALRYKNAQELREILRHPAPVIGHRLPARVQTTELAGQRKKFKQYQPEAVMRKFEQVFLR
jgi:hypothetical protein